MCWRWTLNLPRRGLVVRHMWWSGGPWQLGLKFLACADLSEGRKAFNTESSSNLSEDA